MFVFILKRKFKEIKENLQRFDWLIAFVQPIRSVFYRFGTVVTDFGTAVELFGIS